MSEMERASALLGMIPPYKLGYVIAYMQGLVADQEDIPNETTIAALKEGDEMLRTSEGQGWTGSTEDLFRQILEE